ncbi:MAG: UDP-N-acetylmuramate--L-alanine ligase [FCB group bacterium]|nr:UDP-N-acetylmuramate--L-alanine ligase [FCB group bacterium]MBL7026878.1 UDP-N-acetylmuramate--L-alanine ligase [Candidatus Neomarinimicrobiota bacterium]MBL7121455.1 UDP-N-acetylmuramate--L-alanine ligase [Candidatus Neomarinimicrobiota bacterium]
MLKSARHIHFVGIGGIGMSALALLLKQQGKQVSGSDQMDSELLNSLRKAEIQVFIGHAANHAEGADLVVYSSAVKPDNPERVYAESQGIPEIRRAELLGQIADSYENILAIAGTHGKTTTTGMCGQILIAAGLDPSILVGGILPDLKSNLRLGKQNHIVVEADEYDRSFLALNPTQIIVTTLEADHLDIYKDLQDVRDTFLEFISKLDESGQLVLQGDDPELLQLANRSPHPVISYGLTNMPDYRAIDIEVNSFTSKFTVVKRGKTLGNIVLNMPGDHNVMNALGACTLAHEMGIDFKYIKAGLESFHGMERRFQLKGSKNGVQFVDDYAHHPSEIEATLLAARSGWATSRIIAVFQPHLYSRTKDFAQEFAAALEIADIAILTDIYPARELPIPGVTSDLILKHGSDKIQLLSHIEDVHKFLKPNLQTNDLVITMGAGDIWKLHGLFLEEGK